MSVTPYRPTRRPPPPVEAPPSHLLDKAAATKQRLDELIAGTNTTSGLTSLRLQPYRRHYDKRVKEIRKAAAEYGEYIMALREFGPWFDQLSDRLRNPTHLNELYDALDEEEFYVSLFRYEVCHDAASGTDVVADVDNRIRFIEEMMG